MITLHIKELPTFDAEKSVNRIIKDFLNVKESDEIGWGYYSGVYENGIPGEVVKVSNDSDIGYRNYVDMIEEFKPTSRFLPRIVESYKFLGYRGNVASYAYKIERLKAIHADVELMGKNYERALTITHIFNSRINKLSYWGSSNVADIEHLVGSYIEDRDFNEALAVIELARELSRFERYDLHLNNFMIRPADGSLVITDPLSWSYSYHK